MQDAESGGGDADIHHNLVTKNGHSYVYSFKTNPKKQGLINDRSNDVIKSVSSVSTPQPNRSVLPGTSPASGTPRIIRIVAPTSGANQPPAPGVTGSLAGKNVTIEHGILFLDGKSTGIKVGGNAKVVFKSGVSASEVTKPMDNSNAVTASQPYQGHSGSSPQTVDSVKQLVQARAAAVNRLKPNVNSAMEHDPAMPVLQPMVSLHVKKESGNMPAMSVLAPQAMTSDINSTSAVTINNSAIHSPQKDNSTFVGLSQTNSPGMFGMGPPSSIPKKRKLSDSHGLAESVSPQKLFIEENLDTQVNGLPPNSDVVNSKTSFDSQFRQFVSQTDQVKTEENLQHVDSTKERNLVFSTDNSSFAPYGKNVSPEHKHITQQNSPASLLSNGQVLVNNTSCISNNNSISLINHSSPIKTESPTKSNSPNTSPSKGNLFDNLATFIKTEDSPPSAQFQPNNSSTVLGIPGQSPVIMSSTVQQSPIHIATGQASASNSLSLSPNSLLLKSRLTQAMMDKVSNFAANINRGSLASKLGINSPARTALSMQSQPQQIQLVQQQPQTIQLVSQAPPTSTLQLFQKQPQPQTIQLLQQHQPQTIQLVQQQPQSIQLVQQPQQQIQIVQSQPQIQVVQSQPQQVQVVHQQQQPQVQVVQQVVQQQQPQVQMVQQQQQQQQIQLLQQQQQQQQIRVLQQQPQVQFIQQQQPQIQLVQQQPQLQVVNQADPMQVIHTVNDHM